MQDLKLLYKKSLELVGVLMVYVMAKNLNEFIKTRHKLGKFMGWMNIVQKLDEKPKVREEAQEYIVEVSKTLNQLTTSPEYFDFLNNYIPKNKSEKIIIKNLKKTARLSGYNNSNPEKIRQITDKLTEYEIQFSTNIYTSIPIISLNEKQLKGFPLDKYRAKKGEYNIELSKANYKEMMKYCEKEATRKKVYFAYNKIGYPKNRTLLEKIIKLRKDYAKQLGYNSFNKCMFKLDNRIVSNETQVRNFLRKTNTKYSKKYEEIVSEMVEKLPVGKREIMKPWNFSYYFNLYLEMDKINYMALKTLYPYSIVKERIFAFYENVLKIKIKKAEAKSWSEKVEYFHIYKDGSYQGAFYLDAYTRTGKYNHFAVMTLNTYLADEMPHCVLVLNMEEKEVGMNLYEVETFLHEIGHVFEVVLDRGLPTLSLPVDFVEAPSQMMEIFMKEPKFLMELSIGMEKEVAEKIVKHNEYKRVIQVMTQLYLSEFDLELGSDKLPRSIDRLWQLTFKKYMGMSDKRNFGYCSFEHIVDGYESGYYSYLFSNETAKKLHRKIMKNPKNNFIKYREEILVNKLKDLDLQKRVKNFLSK